MHSKPTISIVIPFFNTPEVIHCLNSLYRQTYGGCEIIVVNNNSSKKYSMLLDHQPVQVLTEPIQSSYAARNRGIKVAKGDYLAFIDADCIADKDWIQNLYQTAIEEHANLVLGSVTKTMSVKQKSHEFVDSDIYHNHRKLFSEGMGTTANLLVSKELLERFSSFPTEYFSGGDTVLIKNLVHQGASYAFADRAVVFHPCRQSLFALMKKGFRTGVADGNRQADGFHGLKDRIKYLRRRCWVLLNPFRTDIRNKAKSNSFSYAFAYFMHFAAHGIGRAIGTTNFSKTNLCKKLLRYT